MGFVEERMLRLRGVTRLPIGAHTKEVGSLPFGINIEWLVRIPIRSAGVMSGNICSAAPTGRTTERIVLNLLRFILMFN